MSKLSQLQQQDPAKFKQVMTDLASKMKDEAATTGDKGLADLASKFSTAATTGDLSALKPEGGAHHGHHGHHGMHGSGPPPSAPPSNAAAQTKSDALQSAIDEVTTALG